MNQPYNQPSYSYFAFISYSRKDEKTARWLQKKLERYSLPSVLRREAQSLPKKVRPIFRDKTDLTTGHLQDALRSELDASKKLIVLCSPQSASSAWVDREVQRFIQTGRTADIIPLIVDGVPGGGVYECFPPSLHMPDERQLLGVSIKELGKNDAFIRVVAGLLDIRYDQIKRRHEQRRKRQRLLIAAASLLFATIGAFSGYRAWDYYVPHESYYADYVLQWGVPQGIGKLTDEQVAVREAHYAITTERGLVRSLVHANSAGTPVSHRDDEYTDRPMISQYYYRDDGRIEYVEYREINDRVLTTLVYTTDLKAVDFQRSMEDSSILTLASSTTSAGTGMFDLTVQGLPTNRSDISRHTLEYDEDGFVVSVIYMKDRRTPILDGDGIGGIEYSLDRLGRVVELRYLGLGGDTYGATKQNIAGKRYYYDSADNCTCIELFDPDGKLTFNGDGWMIVEYDYDSNGNCISESYYDADGRPRNRKEGFASLECRFDGNGNVIRVELFTVDGQRFRSSLMPSAITQRHDANGRLIEYASFDENDEPIPYHDGVPVQEFGYDDRGNVVQVRYYGNDDRPVIGDSGYAGYNLEYDERGNCICETFLGLDGAPINNNLGYAIHDLYFDERDHHTSSFFFGADGAPVLISYGYSSFRATYDDRGNQIFTILFGVDGSPITCAGGFASCATEYDAGGNVLAVSYFGVDGEPILGKYGFASYRVDYDGRGNPVRTAFFGVAGEPVLTSFGYASYNEEYDERGRLICTVFFGLDGEYLFTVDE